MGKSGVSAHGSDMATGIGSRVNDHPRSGWLGLARPIHPLLNQECQKQDDKQPERTGEDKLSDYFIL